MSVLRRSHASFRQSHCLTLSSPKTAERLLRPPSLSIVGEAPPTITLASAVDSTSRFPSGSCKFSINAQDLHSYDDLSFSRQGHPHCAHDRLNARYLICSLFAAIASTVGRDAALIGRDAAFIGRDAAFIGCDATFIRGDGYVLRAPPSHPSSPLVLSVLRKFSVSPSDPRWQPLFLARRPWRCFWDADRDFSIEWPVLCLKGLCSHCTPCAPTVRPVLPLYDLCSHRKTYALRSMTHPPLRLPNAFLTPRH